MVQEALLRVHRTLEAGEQIASPRAFLATVTTRLAINELRSARARREQPGHNYSRRCTSCSTEPPPTFTSQSRI